VVLVITSHCWWACSYCCRQFSSLSVLAAGGLALLVFDSSLLGLLLVLVVSSCCWYYWWFLLLANLWLVGSLVGICSCCCRSLLLWALIVEGGYSCRTRRRFLSLQVLVVIGGLPSSLLPHVPAPLLLLLPLSVVIVIVIITTFKPLFLAIIASPRIKCCHILQGCLEQALGQTA